VAFLTFFSEIAYPIEFQKQTQAQLDKMVDGRGALSS